MFWATNLEPLGSERRTRMPLSNALLTLASCAAGISTCDDNPIYRMLLPLLPVIVIFLLVLVLIGRRAR